ncbi:MAG: hypothetical protein ACD_33C00005G0007 [uncultured bacterium]|nr:MAG: hypothetical protein ACD_33C00005G0007 [uncultured bacterium]
MTGDKMKLSNMCYGNKSDHWVANEVRMLMRDQLNHESICTAARDRIMYLSQEVQRLTERETEAKNILENCPKDNDVDKWLANDNPVNSYNVNKFKTQLEIIEGIKDSFTTIFDIETCTTKEVLQFLTNIIDTKQKHLNQQIIVDSKL